MTIEDRHLEPGHRLQKRVATALTFSATIFFFVSTPSSPEILQPAFAEKKSHNKDKTDRQLRLQVVVDAPPAEVYRMWTTVKGVKSFFGKDAEIDLHVGGKYNIYFMGKNHPSRDALSSKGAKILSLVPGKQLSFEWTAPPFAAEFNKHPLLQWVEIKLYPISNDAKKTIVSLTHQGMGRGSKWDRVYEFFVHAWSRVLFQLDEFLAKKSNATNHKTKPCVCPHHASKESSTSPFTENLNTLANGIKHVGKGHFYVPRKLFDELLSNAKPLLRSARVIPYIKNGTPKGFQLFNIPPGTLYSLLGLQNGDVILAINDFAISTPQEALKAYTKVRKAQKVIVSIKRRGDEKTSKLTYIIIP